MPLNSAPFFPGMFKPLLGHLYRRVCILKLDDIRPCTSRHKYRNDICKPSLALEEELFNSAQGKTIRKTHIDAEPNLNWITVFRNFALCISSRELWLPPFSRESIYDQITLLWYKSRPDEASMNYLMDLDKNHQHI